MSEQCDDPSLSGGAGKREREHLAYKRKNISKLSWPEWEGNCREGGMGQQLGQLPRLVYGAGKLESKVPKRVMGEQGKLEQQTLQGDSQVELLFQELED